MRDPDILTGFEENLATRKLSEFSRLQEQRTVHRRNGLQETISRPMASDLIVPHRIFPNLLFSRPVS